MPGPIPGQVCSRYDKAPKRTTHSLQATLCRVDGHDGTHFVRIRGMGTVRPPSVMTERGRAVRVFLDWDTCIIERGGVLDGHFEDGSNGVEPAASSGGALQLVRSMSGIQCYNTYCTCGCPFKLNPCLTQPRLEQLKLSWHQLPLVSRFLPADNGQPFETSMLQRRFASEPTVRNVRSFRK